MSARIYWDSYVAIYRVEQVEPWFGHIERHLLGLPADARLCLTDLTWMECRVSPMSAANTALLARYDEFFARPEVAWLPLTREVFARAAQLRAAHRIKTPDALHLAAALEGGCTEFWTNDSRLADAASGHVQTIALGDNP